MDQKDTFSAQLHSETDEMPAYRMRLPRVDTGVLFSSPHSGRYYPESFRSLLNVPLLDLRRVEDAYVDNLVEGVSEFGAGLISAVYPRSYVDLNRSETELDSRMFKDGPPTPAGERSPRVEAGLGCIPRIAASGKDIHKRRISIRHAAERLKTAYMPYHQAVSSCLDDVYSRIGMACLIDCHSMPSIVGGRRVQADIVLGNRHGSTCDEGLIRRVEHTFCSLGYRVLRNVPYAGGFLTQKHGAPLEDRHSLQIEINRRLYLNEDKVEPTSTFHKLNRDLLCVAKEICQWSEQNKN